MKNQKGSIYILTAVLLAVAALLFGGALLLSLDFKSKAQLNNIADRAALSTLHAFYHPGATNTAQRIAHSKKVLKEILGSNPVIFKKPKYFEPVAEGSPEIQTKKTTIEFGTYIGETADSCPSPTGQFTSCDCPDGKEVPCFIPVSDPLNPAYAEKIDSVQVTIRTKASEASMPLFAGIASKTSFRPLATEASSTATLLPRCMAFLIDVSGSIGYDSHNAVFWPPVLGSSDGIIDFDMTPHSGGSYSIVSPDNAGMPVIAPRPDTGNMDYECNFDPTVEVVSVDRLHWCAMEKVRPSGCSDPENPGVGCRPHYQSDYDLLNTPYGPLAVNLFKPIEPFDSIMRAINTGLRSVQRRRSGADKVAIIPFNSDAIGPMPPAGLTKNLEFAIDLTDLRRNGVRIKSGTTWITSGAVHPNAVDRGWFPSFAGRGTDYISGLRDAVTRLTSDYCPWNAQKLLFVIGDGVGNYYYPADPMLASPTEKMPIQTQNEFNSYLAAFDESKEHSVLKEILRNRIRVISMLVGETVQPNYRTKADPDNPGLYYSPSDLINQGYKECCGDSSLVANSIVAPNFSSFPVGIKNDPACANGLNDVCALAFSGIYPPLKYRRPNEVFAKLAIKSEGLLCPLMSRYPDVCYDSEGVWYNAGPECVRPTFQDKAPFDESIGTQARRCVEAAVARSPYWLTDPN